MPRSPSACSVVQHREVYVRNVQSQAFGTGTNTDSLGFYSWNVPENLVFGDDNFATFFGFDIPTLRQGLPIEAILERIDVDDRPRIAQAIHTAIVQGGLYQETYRILQPEGDALTVLASGRCFRDEAGTPACWAGMIVADPLDQLKHQSALTFHCRAALEIAEQSGHRTVAGQLRTVLQVIQRWS
ncbi:PAS domain-containing protein [Agrobacterium vitis]|nr:PAS domain-containing protein [Agrobacterium vitis]MUZ62606.1 PAS domain-containing protein [Agrobacterium vitis]